MNLIESLYALEAGKKVTRKDWSKGIYLYMEDRNIYLHKDGKDVITTLRISGDSLYKHQYEVYKEILDEVEKEYLEKILRPFKNEIEYIDKYSSYFETDESIRVAFKGKTQYWCFPCFKTGSMYKGMKANKMYSLEELGLFE